MLYNPQLTWIYPNSEDRNLTATIDGLIMGQLSEEEKLTLKKKMRISTFVDIQIPRVSLETYFDIAKNIISLGDINKDSFKKYNYLKFTKNGDITRACLKKIIRIAPGICPRCHHCSCWQCCNRNNKVSMISTFLTCFHCNNSFKPPVLSEIMMKWRKLSISIQGYQNKRCQRLYGKLYDEYLEHVQKYQQTSTGVNQTNPSPNKILRLYDCLSSKSKRELQYLPDNLNYCLRIGENDLIIPPMTFFYNMNKTMSFFKKMISLQTTATIKTRHGSLISRAAGGKTNIFRVMCCNRRHVTSARIVIVPRSHLKPHQCILPHSAFSRLGCPKYVLCHRYPTLDLKSMTFHEVATTWEYPAMAISTSIVGGNNADFDGDCLHVIPAMSLLSQAELYYLLHPKYNMITQQKLRVQFDHDERQTIYSLFGLNTTEIHEALFKMAQEEGSEKAYAVFCDFKALINFTWESKTVSTVNCKDFLELLPKVRNVSFVDYLNDIYPKITDHNGIKEIVESKASRFGFEHTWQLFGEISKDAPVGFLEGMNTSQFMKIARNARDNLISEISMYGYTIIKLTHCTKSIVIGYDGKIYTTDGDLVALNAGDII